MGLLVNQVNANQKNYSTDKNFYIVDFEYQLHTNHINVKELNSNRITCKNFQQTLNKYTK